MEKPENRPAKLTPQMVRENYDRLIHSIARRWIHTLGVYGYEKNDLVDEVYSKVLRLLPTYNPRLGNPTTFIQTIGQNVLRDLYRNRITIQNSPHGNRIPLDESFSKVEMNTPLDEVLSTDNVMRIYRAIKKLSPRDQEIFLDYLRGKSNVEMAKRYGFVHQAIRNRLTRIRKRLAENLQDMKPPVTKPKPQSKTKTTNRRRKK